MGFRIRPPKGLASLTVLIIAALALFLTGCASNDPQNSLTPIGPVGRAEAGLFTTIYWIAVAVFVIVEALLLYTVIRFRRRPGNDGMPAQTHGSTALELTWTIIPVLILVGIAVPTLTTIASASNIPNTSNTVKVDVVGHQWWWEFDYPGQGVVTADELHIPVGAKVALTIKSADVIHSFWVPKLGGKMQAIPNQVNQLWLQADETGTYDGQCYQLCGTSHANMRFKVVVQSQADYNKWLADQKAVPAKPTEAEIAKGYQVFTTGPCVGCHTIQGTDAKAKIGPDLTHFGSRTTIAGAIMENNPKNLATWLKDPPGVKPGSLMPNYHLTDDQVTALVAYLESLK